jgi:hypothetical protein
VKFADLPAARRRLLTFHARSAALLRLGDAKIRELEQLKLAVDDKETARLASLVFLDDKEEAKSLAARLVFIENLWLVRRMANKQPIYETIDGIDYIMYAPDETTDRRIIAMDRLAKKLGLAMADVDAETNRILEIEESHQASVDKLAAEFMAKLPKPTKRSGSPPTVERRSWRRVVNYDATVLDEVIAVLPERRLIWMERLEFGRYLLGELDDHVRRDGDVEESPAPPAKNAHARRSSLLRAVCEIFDKYDAERRAALKRKSATLLMEFPKGAGDGLKYEARSGDLEAELLQPLHESLHRVLDLGISGWSDDEHRDAPARFRELVIRLAVRVRPASTWPAGNTQFDRALALGRSLEVADDDLATARATLGYAQFGHEQDGARP